LAIALVAVVRQVVSRVATWPRWIGFELPCFVRPASVTLPRNRQNPQGKRFVVASRPPRALEVAYSHSDPSPSCKEFFFANTHFDDKGLVARLEASRLISSLLPQIAASLPALLTGDFNLTEDKAAYAVLVNPTTPGAIRWIDSFREVHPTRGPDEATGHAFKGRTQGSRIDFIFHTDQFIATESAIDRTARDRRYPSDHFPVTAVLRWK
jgi:endonuclease/exonuclease/phosphatase family metal-dependent hydrolase